LDPTSEVTTDEHAIVGSRIGTIGKEYVYDLLFGIGPGKSAGKTAVTKGGHGYAATGGANLSQLWFVEAHTPSDILLAIITSVEGVDDLFTKISLSSVFSLPQV
jgi:hypothetical protein